MRDRLEEILREVRGYFAVRGGGNAREWCHQIDEALLAARRERRDSPSSTDGAGRAESIIARGIAQPWSDYERQASSIVGDLHAAGFEIVARERTRVLEGALRKVRAALTEHKGKAPPRPNFTREADVSDPWDHALWERVDPALAAVAVEDGGNDEGYETPSGRPVPAGEGASVGGPPPHHDDGLLAALDQALMVVGQALEADALRIDGEDQEALRYPLEWYRQAAGRPHQFEALIGGTNGQA